MNTLTRTLTGFVGLENDNTNVGKVERIASVIGGGALIAYSLKKGSKLGFLLRLAGGGLLARGARGYCEAYQALGINTAHSRNSEHVAKDFHVEKSITINSTPAELYNFWRNLENLPRFMENLESVTPLSMNRSHWVAKGPGGKSIEWDAEILNEKENEFIAWRSLSHADVDNAGTVHFTEVPGGRGTEVKVTVNYNAPGGTAGMLLAKLFGTEPGQLIEHNLKRLKQLMETGGIPTAEGQPSGRSEQAAPLFTERQENQKASMAPVSEVLLKARAEGA
ncbi:MAG: SRPBCC family protein [Pyrinomonadaceae bacterium]